MSIGTEEPLESPEVGKICFKHLQKPSPFRPMKISSVTSWMDPAILLVPFAPNRIRAWLHLIFLLSPLRLSPLFSLILSSPPWPQTPELLLLSFFGFSLFVLILDWRTLLLSANWSRPFIGSLTATTTFQVPFTQIQCKGSLAPSFPPDHPSRSMTILEPPPFLTPTPPIVSTIKARLSSSLRLGFGLGPWLYGRTTLQEDLCHRCSIVNLTKPISQSPSIGLISAKTTIATILVSRKLFPPSDNQRQPEVGRRRQRPNATLYRNHHHHRQAHYATVWWHGSVLPQQRFLAPIFIRNAVAASADGSFRYLYQWASPTVSID
ncbi:hypothetical protein BKA70DRAFT_1430405 [Coprinopsis sp. MPI-PUGE-AT-0042]|nr:hypothetical protein BKA70DRAFT_1430405 [Coprinopsis sp. MPI-PUGE-AT-0042]